MANLNVAFARRAMPLGLHLGESAFALCELQHVRAGVELARVVFAPYDDEDDPTPTIARAVREQRWQRRPCVVGIHPDHATLHALKLPPMPAGERRAAARLEAERLAVPRGESLAVDVAAHGDGWLAVWTPSAVVRSAAAIAQGAGLRPRIADPEVFALLRAVDARPGDAVLDIRRSRSTVALAGEAGAPFVRAVATGRATLLARTGAALGLPDDAMQRRAQALGAGGIDPAAFEALATRLSEALAFANSRGFGNAARLLLAGEGAVLEGLAEALAAATQRPVEPAALRRDVSTARHPADFVRATAPAWLAACGLALWRARGRSPWE